MALETSSSNKFIYPKRGASFAAAVIASLAGFLFAANALQAAPHPAPHHPVNHVNVGPTIHHTVNHVHVAPAAHHPVNHAHVGPTIHHPVNHVHVGPTIHHPVNHAHVGPAVHHAVNHVHVGPTIHHPASHVHVGPTIHHPVNHVHVGPTIHHPVNNVHVSPIHVGSTNIARVNVGSNIAVVNRVSTTSTTVSGSTYVNNSVTNVSRPATVVRSGNWGYGTGFTTGLRYGVNIPLAARVAVVRVGTVPVAYPVVTPVAVPVYLAPAVAPRRIANSPAADAPSEIGLKILVVQDNSAAKKADLRPGDVIVAVGQTRVQTVNELLDAVAAAQGQVDIVIVSGDSGKMERLPVTLTNAKFGVTVSPIQLN